MPHLLAMSAPVIGDGNATGDLGLDRPCPPAPEGRYYAVRAGRSVGTSPAIKFRSAIFLHWEDARQFVFGGGIDENDTAEYAAFRTLLEGSEYAAFRTLQEANAYLIEGEGGDAPAAAKDPVAGAGVSAAAPPAAHLLGEDVPAPSPTRAGEEVPTKAAKKRKREPDCEASKEKRSTPKEKRSKISSAAKPLASAATPDNNNNSKAKVQAKRKASGAPANKKASDAPPKDSIDVHAWNANFDRLADHKKETGTLDLKKGEDPDDLIAWARRQKTMLLQHFLGKPSDLTNEQAGRLQSLGYGQSRPGVVRVSGIIDVKSAEEKWNGMLERLKEYKDKNGGSMSFPSDPTPEEREVKNWATEQRREYKMLKKGQESKLTAQRMRLLNLLGFDLSPVSGQVPWETRMEQLRGFVAEHGHCHVPKGHAMFNFVSRVRANYKQKGEGKKNSLTDERVNQLNELGFVWQAGKCPTLRTAERKTWDQRFHELLEFKGLHGHTVVPQNGTGPLGNWVRMQRVAHKKWKAGDQKANMTAEKASKLTEIGFCFDASANWTKKGSRDESVE